MKSNMKIENKREQSQTRLSFAEREQFPGRSRKKRFLIYFTLALPLLFACEDYLEKEPHDKVTDAAVWNDEALIEAYINGLYNYLGIPGGRNNIVTGVTERLTEECWSDNAQHCGGFFMDIHNITLGNYTSADNFGFTFDDIRHANVAIKNIPESTTIDESKKELFLAQAYFFRAYFYSQKVKYFGGLPIIDKPLTQNDELNLPRNTVEECYDFIIADLKKAADALPVEWPAGELGRVTKGAALCLKSRVELYAGKYTEAAKTCEEAMKLGYDLHPDYGELFNKREPYKTSKEVLMVMQFKDPERAHYLELHQNPNRGLQIYGWGAACPTQDLVDEYFVVDNDGVARRWQESKTFTDNFPAMGTHAMWLNRDKRFYATVLYDSTYIEYPGAKQCLIMTVGHPLGYLATGDGQHLSQTGYYPAKFKYMKDQATKIPNYASGPTDVHWIMFRYAEVLLNYAEALIYSGRESEALAPLNKIRDRAGLPPLTNTANIEANYKRERRLELAFECHRYWDLVRWARKDKVGIPELNRPKKRIRIAMNRMSYTIEPSPQAHYQDNFQTPKRYWFPIPFDEIIKNPKLTQNPGWE